MNAGHQISRRSEPACTALTSDLQKNDTIKVFISKRESTCDECHENLGSGAWIMLAGEKGALCLACADLDHLVFLPAGDTALTRRARKHSVLSAVVLEWGRSRKHYERQGVLVEEEALRRAETDCMADGDRREAQRERARVRREGMDRQYVERFAAAVKAFVPNCPKDREWEIAEHACEKYSGRIGRSASAKSFDEQAVKLAVIAHIRHRETRYDTLLAQGDERMDARDAVRGEVAAVVMKWQG